MAGEYAAVLAIERATDGELEFTLYTDGNATGRTAGLVRQASTAVAIADRLARLGSLPAIRRACSPAEFSCQLAVIRRPDRPAA